jgi:ATP-dependent RNA helicase DeaD
LIWLYRADTGARVVTCVGGMDARAEARQLSNPARTSSSARPDACVTTSKAPAPRPRPRSRPIVLDEADEMLDLGFREDLEFILDATPADAARRCCSPPPCRTTSKALARRYQRDAIRIATTRET